MKKILLLGLSVVMFSALVVGCSDDDKNKQWDPNAMVSLRMDKGYKSANATTDGTRAYEHLSALEIVKQTVYMWYYNDAYKESIGGGVDWFNVGFADAQRDFVNERLMMWGADIISQKGEYVSCFIEGNDVVLTREIFNAAGEYVRNDTIAYVPNRVLRAAQKIIKPAYDRGEYDLVYETFDKAFTFIPVTGAEYKELRDKGLN